MKKLLWIGLACLVFLFGCNLVTRDYYLGVDDLPENGKGMLVLILDGSAIPTKTIEPDLSMDIASYRIIGKLNGAVQFTENVNVPIQGGVVTKNGLEPSSLWTVEVTAYNLQNQGGEPIGFGQKAFTIYVNLVVDESIAVLPYSGNGELYLTLPWPPGTVDTPFIDADLIKATDGSSVPIDSGLTPGFTFNGDQAEYSDTNIEAGYYTLEIQLFGNDTEGFQQKVWGDAVSIRIIVVDPSLYSGGQPAIAITDYTWPVINSTGGVDVGVDPDLKNPLGVAISISSATSTTVSATATLDENDLPDPPPVLYDYIWYIDGVEVGSTGSTATTDVKVLTGFAQPLSNGNHNLSVVVTAYIDVGGSNVVDTVSSHTEPFTLP